MSNFKTYDDYTEWCKNCVDKIYYASIAMDDDSIRQTLAEIRRTRWIGEGEELIGEESEQS
jgi:hypothetical protein